MGLAEIATRFRAVLSFLKSGIHSYSEAGRGLETVGPTSADRVI
jgi:hypothetical protein